MKIPKTMREAMSKHKLNPKEFGARIGMNHGTLKNANAGKKSPVIDQFAAMADFAIEHGFDIREIGI